MREAAVEYRGLKLLESEVSSYKDDASVPCEVSLKKMAGLLDKSEHNIQKLIKLRNSVMLSYQHFKIPTNWMLDSGVISKFAGGLDSETLCAFEEIRQRVPGHLRGSQELLVGIPSS
ncbi:hypothetical protein CsSME_00032906 [Camellia sinensis var. sinensis]